MKKSAVSINNKRIDILQKVLGPYQLALRSSGIGPEVLARKRKKQLNAKKAKQIKLKGSIPEGTRLPRGYRVIINGGVTETENGNMIFDDVLVEYRGEDWATQLRATDSLEKIFDEPQPQIIEHTGEINMTNFPPAPASMEEWEAEYRRMRDGKKKDPNDPNATPRS